MRRRIDRRIAELEAASMLAEVSSVEGLKSQGGRYYRIKVGAYRLGIAIEGDTVVLVRFMHRRDVYRHFP